MSYSGLWNREYGEPYSPLGTNNTNELNNTTRKRLSKLLRGRGDRILATLLKSLNGAAVGETANAEYIQIAADPSLSSAYSGGGARVINTKTDIDRVTTAADKTMIDEIIDQTFHPNPYPKDKSGAGGGGKLGRF